MANKDWNDGRSDASSGKGASNQQNKPWQVRQDYNTGYQSAKKPQDSKKSGK
jgi:hypothetical protein